jgi:hypothetical protein
MQKSVTPQTWHDCGHCDNQLACFWALVTITTAAFSASLLHLFIFSFNLPDTCQGSVPYLVVHPFLAERIISKTTFLTTLYPGEIGVLGIRPEKALLSARATVARANGFDLWKADLIHMGFTVAIASVSPLVGC